MRPSAPAGRLRIGRLAALCLVTVALVAACGGGGGGGGGGGDGGVNSQAVIDATQSAIGSSMLGAEVEGSTITITLVDNFGAGGARLFMCSQVKNALTEFDPTGTLTVVMVEQSGTPLISSADC